MTECIYGTCKKAGRPLSAKHQSSNLHITNDDRPAPHLRSSSRIDPSPVEAFPNEEAAESSLSSEYQHRFRDQDFQNEPRGQQERQENNDVPFPNQGYMTPDASEVRSSLGRTTPNFFSNAGSVAATGSSEPFHEEIAFNASVPPFHPNFFTSMQWDYDEFLSETQASPTQTTQVPEDGGQSVWPAAKGNPMNLWPPSLGRYQDQTRCQHHPRSHSRVSEMTEGLNAGGNGGLEMGLQAHEACSNAIRDYGLPSDVAGSSEASVAQRSRPQAPSLQTWMQRLSELSAKLFIQLESCQSDKDDLRQPSCGSKDKAADIKQIAPLATHVLESSIAFSDLLAPLQQQTKARPNAYKAPTVSLTPDGIWTDSENHDHGHQHRASSPPQPASSCHRHAHALSVSSSFATPAVVASTPRPSDLDTATILQLLIAYIRLAQLHHALYTAIHVCLTRPFALAPPAVASSSRLSSPLLSPLSLVRIDIAGVRLDAVCPRLQLRLLLQICMHHLTEIEASLDLPAEFCVSDGEVVRGCDQCSGYDGEEGGRSRRGGAGPLGGFTSLVRTVMLDGGHQAQKIREVLGPLKNAL